MARRDIHAAAPRVSEAAMESVKAILHEASTHRYCAAAVCIWTMGLGARRPASTDWTWRCMLPLRQHAAFAPLAVAPATAQLVRGQ